MKPIAIYLPQFHPIPENDAWWGKGFTEWTNVTKAKPLFSGHYQPHLPSDLGFYDLRLISVMREQALLAKSHGIGGFMFYHYWFSGKKVLHLPIEQWLQSAEIDFPYMLCWANENWTRRWDGNNNDILLKQVYSKEDDTAHFDYLLPFFKDDRYIKVNGKPVLVIYRTEIMEDLDNRVLLWNRLAKEHGLSGIYFIRVESFLSDIEPTSIQFDAAMEFQPKWDRLPKRKTDTLVNRALTKLGIKESVYKMHRIYEFEDLVKINIERPLSTYKKFPCITPMWDNTARKARNGVIFKSSTPELFYRWCKHVKDTFIPYSESENFVFINAWNEWAEGCHLEPCQKWGKQYLEVIDKVFGK